MTQSCSLIYPNPFQVLAEAEIYYFRLEYWLELLKRIKTSRLQVNSTPKNQFLQRFYRTSLNQRRLDLLWLMVRSCCFFMIHYDLLFFFIMILFGSVNQFPNNSQLDLETAHPNFISNIFVKELNKRIVI